VHGIAAMRVPRAVAAPHPQRKSRKGEALRTRILKFGGSSLTSADQIEAAADRIHEVLSAGLRPVVVVSAMQGITNRLLGLARRLHPDPPGDELDRLLVTGEAQATSLVALALHARNVPARSFSGSEAGILTDHCFGQARILEVGAAPLMASLAAGEVPVVTGFQGSTRDGRITTLGRGGSDITAVAVARALDADRVVFFRDVEGVHSADPKLLPSSYRIDRLDYDSMIDLCEAGSSILHPQCLEIARAHELLLEVRGLSELSSNTMVGRESSNGNMPVWSISLSHPVALVSIDSLPGDVRMIARLLRLLERTDLCLDGDIQATDSDSGLCLTLMAPDAEGPALRSQVADFLREERRVVLDLERRRRKITLVGRGVGSRKVQKSIEDVVQRLGPPLAGYRGTRHLGFVVADREARSWLASLHRELIQR
jgi:aspartate kinase